MTPKEQQEMINVVRESYPSSITLDECENLPTARLLAYYKKRRNLLRIEECDTDLSRARHALLEGYMTSIKAMLDHRGHVN